MHQKIDKKNKIYIYIFIFFLLSTFNNLQLVNSNFFKFNVDKIKISGLSEKNNLYISEEIEKLFLKNIFIIEKDFLFKILEKNNLISSFEIKKIYPNTIEVEIEEAKLLAITIIEERFFFIGSNGKLIDYDSSNTNLPYVFGKVKTVDFINFVKIIEQSKFNFKEISEMYFYPSGRWDIKNKHGILFKLPKKNLIKSLNIAYRIIDNEKLKNSKIIDLRISNHIVSTDEWKKFWYIFKFKL